MVIFGVVLLLLPFVWQIVKLVVSAPRKIPTQPTALAVLPNSVNMGDSGGLTAWILPLTVRRAPDSIRIRLRSNAGLPRLRWTCGRDFVGCLGELTATQDRRVQERENIAYRHCIQAMDILEYGRTYAR